MRHHLLHVLRSGRKTLFSGENVKNPWMSLFAKIYIIESLVYKKVNADTMAGVILSRIASKSSGGNTVLK